MKFFTAKLKSTADFYTQIALILVIVLLLESIFAFLPLRFDATQAKIYSISEVTKKTLKGLDDIVTIKGYFTEELPGYLITVRQNVKDILAEYRNFGGARIKVQFLNPNANDALKSEAQSLGLPAIQFNVVKKDKYEVAQGYLGIAVLYGDRVETIPVVQDTSALEYNLTAAIKKVISGTDFTVGILQKTDSLLSEEQDLQALQQILSRQYRVERISLENGDLISKDITSLIIPGPKGQFSERELYVIDQFVMSGRGVLVLIDGVSVEQGLIPQTNDSNIFDLLTAFGVKVRKDLVYDSVSRGQAAFSQGFMQFFTPYSYWPKILSSGFDKNSALVNKLESVVLPWASTIDLEVSAKRVALAKTSPNSKRVSENFNLAPEGILEGGGTEPSGDKGSQIVAVYVTDKLDSHFKDAVLKKDGTDKAGDFKKETEKARLIVVSDADIARDNMLQRFDSDVVFLQNLVDGLTLDESLSTIRAKTVSERQIRELDATGRSLVKYGNIIAVPFILVIFAVLRFMWRRKGQRVMEEGL